MPPPFWVQRENRPSEARVMLPVPIPPSGTPVAQSGGKRWPSFVREVGRTCPAGLRVADTGMEWRFSHICIPSRACIVAAPRFGIPPPATVRGDAA